jgi:hypothetical protein
MRDRSIPGGSPSSWANNFGEQSGELAGFFCEVLRPALMAKAGRQRGS